MEGYLKKLHRSIPFITWDEKAKQNNTEITYFKLDIKIINKKFKTSLHDKRSSFSFSMERMSYLDSNMPSRIFCSSIGAKILRICGANNTNSKLENAAKTSIKNILKHGGKLNTIKKTKKTLYKI